MTDDVVKNAKERSLENQDDDWTKPLTSFFGLDNPSEVWSNYITIYARLTSQKAAKIEKGEDEVRVCHASVD
jgi:hypothetical protein